MKLYNNIQLNTGESVTVEEWTRGGTLSPTTYIIHYRGRRVPPYEQTRRGLCFSLNGLFKLHYEGLIAEEIKKPNELFKRIAKGWL